MAINTNVFTRDKVLLTSAARTTHASTPDQQSNGARGIRVDIDITAFTGTSITFTIETYDRAKGGYVTELASAALVAAGHTILQVSPNSTAAANLAVNRIVPKRWRVTPSGTITSVTYSVLVTYQP